MHARGLLRREECTSDARGAEVVLTEQGRGAIDRAAPNHVQVVRRHFIDLLTPRQALVVRQIAAEVAAHAPAREDRL
jgi:DNA-binding MarR family transcriptional regulator